MKTKNKKTFAKRAETIVKAYPRAKYDLWEKEGLRKAMKSLMDEQERERELRGMNQEQQYAQQMPMQRMPQEEQQMSPEQQLMMMMQSQQGQQIPQEEELPIAGNGLGWKSPLPLSFNPEIDKIFNPGVIGNQSQGMHPSPPPSILPLMSNNAVSNHSAVMGKAPGNIGISTKTSSQSPQLADTDRFNKFTPDAKTSLVPSYIAAGTNILGNLLQMGMDKKPSRMSSERYSPEQIDLYKQRIGMQQDADVANRMSMTQARNLGLNTGQTLNAINASNADIFRGLGKGMMDSELAEQQFNVGARNEAGQFNSQLGMREAMMNRQLEDDWRQRNMGYVAGALGTIPGLMQDTNKIKYQDKYMNQQKKADWNRLNLLRNMFPNYTFDMNDPVTQMLLKKIEGGR